MNSNDPSLTFDEFGTPGKAGYYKRWHLRCPLRDAQHWVIEHECGRRRNIGPVQCQHFGELEPQAFLLAWAAKASAYDDKGEHMKYNPSVAEVREFLAARGLI